MPDTNKGRGSGDDEVDKRVRSIRMDCQDIHDRVVTIETRSMEIRKYALMLPNKQRLAINAQAGLIDDAANTIRNVLLDGQREGEI